jgi:hypothetical protein
VVGHRLTVERLEGWCRTGEIPHALLLIGAEGVGKTTLATRFATLLLGAENWPGGVAAHPDCYIEDSDQSSIGIDQVRGDQTTPGVRMLMAERPYADGFRVAVLARAERLTESAANALLKVIEEPPDRSVILLCVTSPDRLPATVRSRCQSIQLSPVPAPDIAAWLQGRGVGADRAELCARVSSGRPGRAHQLATDPSVLTEEMGWVSTFLSAPHGGVAGVLRAARQLAPPASGVGFLAAREQVGVFTQVVRDAACVQSGVPELITWTPFEAAITEWARRIQPEQVVGALTALTGLSDELSRNAMPRLAYEVVFLELFSGRRAMPGLTPDECQPRLTAVPEKAGMGMGLS